MTLSRRWIITCDSRDCFEILICPPGNDPIYGDDRGTAGIYVSDHGWEARPNRQETYCPDHRKD